MKFEDISDLIDAIHAKSPNVDISIHFDANRDKDDFSVSIVDQFREDENGEFFSASIKAPTIEHTVEALFDVLESCAY